MKKTITTLTFLLFVFGLFSQQVNGNKKQIPSKLLSVNDVFKVANFYRVSWELYSKYNDAKYSPTNSEDVSSDFNQYLSKGLPTDLRQGEATEFNFLTKYKVNIESLFKEFSLLGSDQLGKFIYSKEGSLPVHFALYGDTAKSIIITGVYIENVYNTLKLTSRQRATKVITSYILTSLKSYASNFQGKEIKYFGMSCLYGSKDFSDDYSTKAEFVGFIAPARLIRKYTAGNLTEDDLINAADIYISDREMVTEIKKIKITLE